MLAALEIGANEDVSLEVWRGLERPLLSRWLCVSVDVTS